MVKIRIQAIPSWQVASPWCHSRIATRDRFNIKTRFELQSVTKLNHNAHIYYKQHVYKPASLDFAKKLSTQLNIPSASDWLEVGLNLSVNCWKKASAKLETFEGWLNELALPP